MTKSKKLGPLDESGMHTVIETDEATPDAAETTVTPKDEPQKPLPGDADYDWSAHYGDIGLYRHTFRDGTVVALRPFGSVFSKTLLWKLRNAESESEVQFTAIMRGGCPAVDVVLDRVAAAVLAADDYEYDPIAELFALWMKAGTSTTEDADDGLSLGKSAS